MGDVKLYSWLTIGSMVLGIGVSPILTISCKLEEYGAAVARILCNLIPTVIFLVYYAWFDKVVKPFSLISANLKGAYSPKMVWQELKNVCALGVSNMVMILLWTVYLAI